MTDSHNITPALENYLEAIFILQKVKKRVRISEIAGYLDVKMPSVTYNMDKLLDRGLIHYKKREYVTLTESGEKTAREVLRKHEEFFRFFHEILGVPKETAENEACRAEHVFRNDTINRLSHFMMWYFSLSEEARHIPAPPPPGARREGGHGSE